MRRFLLATDVLSDLVRHPRGAVAARIAEVGVAATATSVVAAGELLFGWVAAHALATDRVLATGNGRASGAVPALTVVDWRG